MNKSVFSTTSLGIEANDRNRLFMSSLIGKYTASSTLNLTGVSSFRNSTPYFSPATPLAIRHPLPASLIIGTTTVVVAVALAVPVAFALSFAPLLLIFPFNLTPPPVLSIHLPSIFSLQSLPYLPTRAPLLSFQPCCWITCP
jgi:hypothetical protein